MPRIKNSTSRADIELATAVGAVPAQRRKVLCCVTGLFPQVVTETIYSLATGSLKWMPDELHIISTETGVEQAQLKLLVQPGGKLWALCEQYELPVPDPIFMHVIGPDDAPTDDTRTSDANDATANTTFSVLKELTKLENTEIHFSIAGGRKTMTYYLGYCASLLARPQDRMSHVLVSEEFEGNAKFFFPPVPAITLKNKEGKEISTENARIDLALVSFIRLRSQLPENLIEAKRSFSDTVRIIDSTLTNPSITLTLLQPKKRGGAFDRRVTIAGGLSFELPALSFALLWLAASLRKIDGPTRFRLNYGITMELLNSYFLPVYRAVTGNSDKALNAGESIKGNRVKKDEIVDATTPRESESNRARYVQKLFKSSFPRLINDLKKHIGPFVSVYGVHSFDNDGDLAYSLGLPPEKITLEDQGLL
jgi:CRISPR-associated protein (TIGR02584 family)